MICFSIWLCSSSGRSQAQDCEVHKYRGSDRTRAVFQALTWCLSRWQDVCGCWWIPVSIASATCSRRFLVITCAFLSLTPSSHWQGKAVTGQLLQCKHLIGVGSFSLFSLPLFLVRGKHISLSWRRSTFFKGMFPTRLLCSGYWLWPVRKWIEPFKHVSSLVLKIYSLILMKDDGFFNHKLGLVLFKCWKCHLQRIYCAGFYKKRQANSHILSSTGPDVVWHTG